MKAHEKLSRELGRQLGPVLAPARREFQAIPEGNLEEPGRREGKQVGLGGRSWMWEKAGMAECLWPWDPYCGGVDRRVALFPHCRAQAYQG